MTERKNETLTIYTLAWAEDQPIEDKDTDTPNGSIYCRAFLDDREVVCTVKADPHFSADFRTVTLEIAPASVRVVECTKAEWDAL